MAEYCRVSEPIYHQVAASSQDHHPEVSLAMGEVACLPTLEELKEHVHFKLCEPDKLDRSQTPLWQAVITRRGKMCGLFFQVQGPRALKTYAIWAGDENRILFYNSSGERFAESRLSEAPNPNQLAA